MPRQLLRVVVQNVSSSGSLPAAAELRHWVRLALGGARGEVTVRIVDETESAELNERFRRRTGPTNVLSFPVEEWPGHPGEECAPLGDLVLCAPVIEREAREQAKALTAHWAHMLIHGSLHLLGHDHDRPESAGAMESIERDMLAKLGYPDPYA